MRLEYLPHLTNNCDAGAGAVAVAENIKWNNLSVPDCHAGASAEKKKKKKPPMMTMEMYLNFIQSNKKMNLVYHHLNQIIRLHGFKKIHKHHKGVLMDAVNSMELMDPARSTVNKDGVSPEASLSVEEVINDLTELKWQESCITSMETLNDVVYQHHQQPLLQNSPDTGGSYSGSGSASALSSAEAKHPKRKRRLRRLRDIMEDWDDDVVSGDSTAACSSPNLVVAKWLRTKERKMRLKRTNFGKIGWGGGGGGRLDDTPLPALVEVENQLWPSF